MTTDVRTPVDVDTPAPIPPPPAPPSRRQGGRAWQFVLGGLVGGLCGALAAGGLFLAFDDDDGGSSPTPAVRTAEIDRSSSTIGGEQGDVASIIAKVEPAVVTITTEVSGPIGSGQGAGTGFVISSDGLIVTNNHVVAGANSIEVAFADGRTLEADVVGRNGGADLAVLKADATDLPVVELGDSDALQVGDEVVAIGNALALEGGLTVTRGIISGPPREGTELGAGLASFLQTDASINPGNSGGPLVDAAGRVIGINTMVAGNAENVGFAIPISDAMPVIEDLRSGRVPAFLGVATDTLTPEIADEIGVDADSGAVILEVTEGSPADEAGLREEDVLVRIGDVTIETASDVPDAIRQHQPGDEVEVEVLRGDQRETVTARLVEREDSVG